MSKSLARKSLHRKGDAGSDSPSAIEGTDLNSSRTVVESGELEYSTERLFTSSLRVAFAVASGRRAVLGESNIADLTQNVALKVWRWLGTHREKSELMTESDWASFTARSTHNEINRHFRSRSRSTEVPLEEARLVTSGHMQGEAQIEVISMIQKVWQGICTLSLKQCRALILHSPELVLYLMQAGIDGGEIAGVLDISRAEWGQICDRMPLSDFEIAELMGDIDSRSVRASARAVKKARFDARKKLERLKK